MKKYIYITLLTLSSLLIFGFSQLDDSNSYVDLKELNPLMDRIEINGLIDDTTRMACCKICTKGKACGDSCISKSYTCHKPPGCACNG